MRYHWEDTDERLTCRIIRRRLNGQYHFCLQRILTTGNRRIRQLESVWFGIADFCGSPPALRSSTDKVSLNKEKKRTQTQFSKGGPCWAQHRHRSKTSVISHFPLFFSCYMNIYSHYYIARNVLSSLRDLMMGQKILASEASLYINKEDVLYSDGENGRSTKETQVRHSQFRASGVAQLGIRCRPGLREGDDRQGQQGSWGCLSHSLLLIQKQGAIAIACPWGVPTPGTQMIAFYRILSVLQASSSEDNTMGLHAYECTKVCVGWGLKAQVWCKTEHLKPAAFH